MWRRSLRVWLNRNTYRCSGLLEGLLGKAGHVVDDRGEVGGTVEFNLGQTHPVGVHHTLNTYTRTRILNNLFQPV